MCSAYIFHQMVLGKFRSVFLIYLWKRSACDKLVKWSPVTVHFDPDLWPFHHYTISWALEHFSPTFSNSLWLTGCTANIILHFLVCWVTRQKDTHTQRQRLLNSLQQYTQLTSTLLSDPGIGNPTASSPSIAPNIYRNIFNEQLK